MRLISLKLVLSLLFAQSMLSAAHATPPPLRCADLIISADRAGKDIADHSDRRVVLVDGETLANPDALTAAVNKQGVEATIIVGGNFHGWDFSGLSLGLACFVDADLSQSNWSQARLSAPAFVRTDLEGSNFQGANIAHVYFDNSNLKEVNARDANLSWGRFGGGWFEGSVEGWTIDGADLTGFVFDCGITVSDGCPVYQGGAAISVKGTNFTRATLHSFSLYNVALTGALLDQTIIGPGQLPDVAQAEFRGDIIFRGGVEDVRLTAEEAQILLAENAGMKAVKDRPSFDCSKAATKVETEICGEYASDLRLADRDIAALYQRAQAVDSGVRASQLTWLKQRNKCAVEEYPSACIRDSYSLRKGQLLGLLGETDWLVPGETALFIDDVLPLPASFRQSELFAEIMPALVGASMTEILVERSDQGLYSINGSAVGANAHMCSINASHLYFDKQSGWYIPVSEGPAIPIFRIFDGRLEIFADGKPDYEQYPQASGFMSCGMRASFGETVRINVGDALIENYRQSLNEEM
ncbi:pentapeptide repeat-containing protein [Parasphingorhabdus sp.]|uniref:pentapeptide repeat-containing protein n=1 Tax=Parasphingorhabdus sp. TaxID=2709688 RepID=UPI003A9453E9